MTSRSLVHIVDIITGKHYGLKPTDLRPMTASEIEQYNDTPPVGSPNREEISAVAAAIRSEWSSSEERSRRRGIQDFFNLFMS